MEWEKEVVQWWEWSGSVTVEGRGEVGGGGGRGDEGGGVVVERKDCEGWEAGGRGNC